MNKTFENKVATKGTGKLTLESGDVDFPVIVGTENEHAIDISKLRAKTGYITWDEGFMNTGATTSAITFLDGEAGILRYRGYPVEQLAANCDFIEVSYLQLGYRGAVHVLPGFTERYRSRAGEPERAAFASQAADYRGVRVQEIDRPA